VWNWDISYFVAGLARCAHNDVRAEATEIHHGGTYVYLHLFVAAIVHDQAVRNSDSVRFHGVAGDVCIIAHIGIVEVSNFLGLVGAICEFVLVQRSSIVISHAEYRGFRGWMDHKDKERAEQRIRGMTASSFMVSGNKETRANIIQ